MGPRIGMDRGEHVLVSPSWVRESLIIVRLSCPDGMGNPKRAYIHTMKGRCCCGIGKAIPRQYEAPLSRQNVNVNCALGGLGNAQLDLARAGAK